MFERRGISAGDSAEARTLDSGSPGRRRGTPLAPEEEQERAGLRAEAGRCAHHVGAAETTEPAATAEGAATTTAEGIAAAAPVAAAPAPATPPRVFRTEL